MDQLQAILNLNCNALKIMGKHIDLLNNRVELLEKRVQKTILEK
jgi:hypothetical protein